MSSNPPLNTNFTAKRGRKGKANIGDGTSEKTEEVPTTFDKTSCQDFECHVQCDEDAGTDVLAICHGLIKFPFLEKSTNVMMFFDGKQN